MVGNPELIIRGITGFAAGTASAGIPRGGGETLPPLSKTHPEGFGERRSGGKEHSAEEADF